MHKKRPDILTILIAVCLLIVLAGGGYLAWARQRDEEIAFHNGRYRAMLADDSTDGGPQATSTEAPGDTPLPTPDANTIQIRLPTAPPADERYAQLLATNPDFCGWLRAGEDIDLPVVHRLNDNDTYLSTNLDGAPSDAGTLFVDGYNRLYPADTLTVIYGHNMNSGEMFGRLHRFQSGEYLLEHPIVAFDTLYGEGQYAPFAAFYASIADVDIRQFQPTVEEFNALVDQFRQLSLYDDGIDVRYGDELLALVTCAGSDADRRFFLICRKLRAGETALSALLKMEAALEN
ncbi:MAG: class B sortase [Clostridia bacterium]|nr:class B sortase [Clostridia bacterium]